MLNEDDTQDITGHNDLSDAGKTQGAVGVTVLAVILVAMIALFVVVIIGLVNAAAMGRLGSQDFTPTIQQNRQLWEDLGITDYDQTVAGSHPLFGDCEAAIISVRGGEVERIEPDSPTCADVATLTVDGIYEIAEDVGFPTSNNQLRSLNIDEDQRYIELLITQSWTIEVTDFTVVEAGE